MIYMDRLIVLRDIAKKTLQLQIECAEKGHNHVIASETLTSLEVLEMTSELLNFRHKFGQFEGIKK